MWKKIKIIANNTKNTSILFSCYGATHHSYVVAHNIIEAGKKTQTSDVNPVELLFLSNEDINMGDRFYNYITKEIERCTSATSIESSEGVYEKLIGSTNPKHLSPKPLPYFIEVWAASPCSMVFINIEEGVAVTDEHGIFIPKHIHHHYTEAEVVSLFYQYWLEKVFPYVPYSKAPLQEWIQNNITNKPLEK
jgi:hypothetical protein